jgi:hypothetical protein
MEAKHLSTLVEVVNLFVTKERRERFIEQFSKPKRYNDALTDLLHDPRYFDKKVIIEIPAREYTPESIYAHLQKVGFKDRCFVISDDLCELDGKTLPTLEALKSILFNTDSMLFCPISKIGYYEGHEGWRYILQKQKVKVS